MERIPPNAMGFDCPCVFVTKVSPEEPNTTCVALVGAFACTIQICAYVNCKRCLGTGKLAKSNELLEQKLAEARSMIGDMQMRAEENSKHWNQVLNDLRTANAQLLDRNKALNDQLIKASARIAELESANTACANTARTSALEKQDLASEMTVLKERVANLEKLDLAKDVDALKGRTNALVHYLKLSLWTSL